MDNEVLVMRVHKPKLCLFILDKENKVKQINISTKAQND